MAARGHAGLEEASKRLVPGGGKCILVGNEPSGDRRIEGRPPLRLRMVVGFCDSVCECVCVSLTYY